MCSNNSLASRASCLMFNLPLRWLYAPSHNRRNWASIASSCSTSSLIVVSWASFSCRLILSIRGFIIPTGFVILSLSSSATVWLFSSRGDFLFLRKTLIFLTNCCVSISAPHHSPFTPVLLQYYCKKCTLDYDIYTNNFNRIDETRAGFSDVGAFKLKESDLIYLSLTTYCLHVTY